VSPIGREIAEIEKRFAPVLQRSSGRLVERTEHLQQSCLPATTRANDRDKLAFADLKIYASQSVYLAVVVILFEPSRLKDERRPGTVGGFRRRVHDETGSRERNCGTRWSLRLGLNADKHVRRAELHSSVSYVRRIRDAHVIGCRWNRTIALRREDSRGCGSSPATPVDSS
jgi:hypothetical protein